MRLALKPLSALLLPRKHRRASLFFKGTRLSPPRQAYRLVLICAAFLLFFLFRSKQAHVFETSSAGAKPFTTLAVVYPQYHPVPENDLIYGIGFVEWTLLQQTPKEFMGMKTLKPHRDIGYYNLLDFGHRRNMRLMANHFEVDGFIWYHYYLNHTYPLNRPAELMLLDGEPDVPFCFCYANEDWSRNWDGSNRDVVLKHMYGNEQQMVSHFKYLRRFFRHKNYLQLHGKPVVMMYRVERAEATKLATLSRIWNAEARKSGWKGIKFVRYLGPFDNSVKVSGFDEGVLFQPGFAQQRVWNYFTGVGPPIFDSFDAESFAAWNPELSSTSAKESYISLNAHGRSLALSTIWSVPLARVFSDINNYQLSSREHPGLVYSWSNHPRRQIGGKVSAGHRTIMYSDPSYEQFLKCARTMFNQIPKMNRQTLVVLTAWNEWNEQAVFEPSDQNGYLPLLAIQRATFKSVSLPILGRIIHVSHYGGGTERYVRDLGHLFPRYEHVVVSSEKDITEAIDSYASEGKPLVLHLHSVFVNGGVGRTILHYANLVHRLAGRVITTVHDFQWFVPTDPNRMQMSTPSADDLAFCREVFLASDLIIFPSKFTASEYTKALGTLQWYNVHIAQHPDYGIDHEAMLVPEIYEHISLAFLGEFSLRKGADMLEKILEAFKSLRIPIKISVHGIVASDAIELQMRLHTLYGVEFKGQYDETFIVEELRRSNVHVILLLSAVEETYCYALTLALNSGIAILHSGAGAIGERLQGYERAFKITKGENLKTVLSDLKLYLKAHEGIKTEVNPSSGVVQPTLWYIENYPVYPGR